MQNDRKQINVCLARYKVTGMTARPRLLSARKTDGGQGSSSKRWSDAVGEIEGQTETLVEGGWRHDERAQERLMGV